MGADLSKALPSEEESYQISEVKLYVGYKNGLPLGIDFEIEFLDSLGNELDRIPLQGDVLIELNAASIDDHNKICSF